MAHRASECRCQVRPTSDKSSKCLGYSTLTSVGAFTTLTNTDWMATGLWGNGHAIDLPWCCRALFPRELADSGSNNLLRSGDWSKDDDFLSRRLPLTASSILFSLIGAVNSLVGCPTILPEYSIDHLHNSLQVKSPWPLLVLMVTVAPWFLEVKCHHQASLTLGPCPPRGC